MKHVKNLIILALVLFLVSYLLGAFYSVTFGVSLWTDSTRNTFVWTFVTALIFGFTAYAIHHDNKTQSGARIVLKLDDFSKLVKGKEVEYNQDGTVHKIILSDIGFRMMQHSIDHAKTMME